MINPTIIHTPKHTPIRQMRKHDPHRAPKQHINRMMPTVPDLARRNKKRNKPRKYPDNHLPMPYPPLSPGAKVSAVAVLPLPTTARFVCRQRFKPSTPNHLELAIKPQRKEPESGKRRARVSGREAHLRLLDLFRIARAHGSSVLHLMPLSTEHGGGYGAERRADGEEVRP